MSRLSTVEAEVVGDSWSVILPWGWGFRGQKGLLEEPVPLGARPPSASRHQCHLSACSEVVWRARLVGLPIWRKISLIWSGRPW